MDSTFGDVDDVRDAVHVESVALPDEIMFRLLAIWVVLVCVVHCLARLRL
jgi:hypothetical protein